MSIHHLALLLRERLSNACDRIALVAPVLPAEYAPLVRNAYERDLDVADAASEKGPSPSTPPAATDEEIDAFIAKYTTLPVFPESSSGSSGAGDSPAPRGVDTGTNADTNVDAEVICETQEATPQPHLVRKSTPPATEPSSNSTSESSSPQRKPKIRGTGILSTYVRVLEGRRFQCTICGHTAARAYDVKRHVTKHDIESPHQCLGCGMRFKRTDARGRHWAKFPDCYKIDEAMSRGSREYAYRHGRRLKNTCV